MSLVNINLHLKNERTTRTNLAYSCFKDYKNGPLFFLLQINERKKDNGNKIVTGVSWLRISSCWFLHLTRVKKNLHNVIRIMYIKNKPFLFFIYYIKCYESFILDRVCFTEASNLFYIKRNKENHHKVSFVLM